MTDAPQLPPAEPAPLIPHSPLPIPHLYEVVVVGAGAAGLLAAARLAERGKRTLLLEKNRKPGVKILMSGGTRCNVTHDCDRKEIIPAFGRNGQFLHSALAALGPKELVALLEAEGVPTTIEPDTGKIFPASNRSVDVLNALMARLRRSTAELAFEEPLVEVRQTAEGFELQTSRRVVHTARLLITTGGQSYPGCGTTGDGYRWAAQFGHTIVTPRPALVPITTEAAWVRELSGVTIPDMGLRVIEPLPAEAPTGKPRKPKVLAERRGSVLFAHFGLTGPAPLDVSRAISGHPAPLTLQLTCDFLPDVSEAELEQELREFAAAAGKKLVVSIMPASLPQRLLEALIAQVGIAPERRAAELTRVERMQLAAALKRTVIAPSGTRGFSKAEVTAGGVALDEVDSRTMAASGWPASILRVRYSISTAGSGVTTSRPPSAPAG